MVVAGDHANNDMAGSDEDSWLSQFNAADCFERRRRSRVWARSPMSSSSTLTMPGRHRFPERLRKTHSARR